MTDKRRAKTFPFCFSFLLQFSQKFSHLSKHHGRGQRPKISQSEGESAGESGERRRWEHAEYVFFSFFVFSLSLFLRYPLLHSELETKHLWGSLFILSLSLTNIITTEANEAAKSIQCKVCMQAFVSTLSHSELKKHAENKHPKLDAKQCFPFLE
jgi:hypothetical protein|tara:strand:- start:2259 stop:2723 length:465 start_codon:yes stop_codon:yes gene_type:complete